MENTETVENKSPKCLYCSSEIIGRSDKKFCDSHCRSAYHNKKTNNQEHYIRSINKQLRANRSALKIDIRILKTLASQL